MTIYLELGDYCEIAAELLGTSAEQIARLPRIALADSALEQNDRLFAGEAPDTDVLMTQGISSFFGIIPGPG